MVEMLGVGGCGLGNLRWFHHTEFNRRRYCCEWMFNTMPSVIVGVVNVLNINRIRNINTVKTYGTHRRSIEICCKMSTETISNGLPKWISKPSAIIQLLCICRETWFLVAIQFNWFHIRVCVRVRCARAPNELNNDWNVATRNNKQMLDEQYYYYCLRVCMRLRTAKEQILFVREAHRHCTVKKVRVSERTCLMNFRFSAAATATPVLPQITMEFSEYEIKKRKVETRANGKKQRATSINAILRANYNHIM